MDGSVHEASQNAEPKNETTSEGSSSKDELYRGITIGIVLFGLLLIILLILYVIRENRKERHRREERSKVMKEEAGKDNPPTYAQIVLRKEPPEYHESVMQEINPETNPNWSADLLHADVRETISTKVQSQAHGLYYRLLGRTSQYDLEPQAVEMMAVTPVSAAEVAAAEGSASADNRRPSHPIFIVGEALDSI
ncbi:unnamed protein product [Sphagnum tenellum]